MRAAQARRRRALPAVVCLAALLAASAACAQDAPPAATPDPVPVTDTSGLKADAESGPSSPPTSPAPAAVASSATSDPAGGAVLATAATPQILPPSPVPGANDPNASDDALYVIESNDEDAQRRARLGRKAHVFVNPSARLAATKVLSPALTIEAFMTGNAAAYERTGTAADKMPHSFGPRASSVSGGFNANGTLPLVNFSLAYEHRDAHTELFGPWSAETDRMGVTVNKTYPLFVQNLRFTPQVQAADEVVDPYKASSATVEASAGLTYDATPRLSLAASLGYQAVRLTGLAGQQHNSGLKLLLGATCKVTDRFTIVAGATAASTDLYRVPAFLADGSINPASPAYRADGSISPQLTFKYQIMPGLTASLVANYGRFISTATGQSTFKYNINPSIALSVPL